MKVNFPRWIAAALSAACIASSAGCYPAYAPLNDRSDASAYGQDSKGYTVPQEPAPPQAPQYAGVDPGVVVAGAATVGLLGYAVGNHHGYYYRPAYGPRYIGRPFYGPRFYRPVFYRRGYVGRRYYR